MCLPRAHRRAKMAAQPLPQEPDMGKNRKTTSGPKSARETEAEPALDRRPTGKIDLRFRQMDRVDYVDDPIFEDVSALAVVGRSIFCTCDETSTVERLLYAESEGAAVDHTSFALGEVFDLPGGPRGEMDIEGLAVSDGHHRP
jgi:hypothetical protein